MKALLLGSGNIGSIAAQDLAKAMGSTEIVIADKDAPRAKRIAEGIGEPNVSWIKLDVLNRVRLVHTLKDFDLAMGFLPGNLGYSLMQACIEAQTDLVDVSYTAENPLTLHRPALEASITIVPDCGLAPGISNFLVGNASRKLDKVEAVHIMVGGLPEKPVPPLGYVITWSPESLIDEYTRRAVIVKRRRRVQVKALTGTEVIEFPRVGKLEAFYTDGLRTLAQTMTGVEDMWEKTLRYPGHAEKIGLLEALGFFDEEEISIQGAEVSPRKLTVKLLERRLHKPEARDIVVLKVEVCGIKDNKKTRYTYHLLDRYDKKRRITAMARTTAYPMSIVAQMILKKTVMKKGVVPPEKLGMDDELFKMFIDSSVSHGIEISEEKTTG